LVDRGATTLCLPEGAIAIPSKTQQQIALCFYCSFSTKRDRSFGISQKVSKQKKPGFSDNLYVLTDILYKNPVSKPPY